jgi:serine/threonine-protein kinase ATR
MESYKSSYSVVCKLHILHELEESLELLGCSDSLKKSECLDEFHWDKRSVLMSDSAYFRTLTFATRKSVLGISNLEHKIGQICLNHCQLLRQQGHLDAALFALKQSWGYKVDPDVLLLEQCKIMKDQGLTQKALTILEPVEIDVGLLNSKLESFHSGEDSTEHNRKMIAQRVHLATKLMIESQQCQGSTVVERFRTVVALDPTWLEAYFDFGKYYEYLYNDSLIRDQDGKYSSVGSNTLKPSSSSIRFFQKAIEKYGLCLETGNLRLAIQVLPRFLTLWLSFSSFTDMSQLFLPSSTVPKKLGSSARKTVSDVENKSEDDILSAAQCESNKFISLLVQKIAPNVWFYSLQQITSRVLHSNKKTVEVLEHMLLKILTAFPKQTIWNIAPLMYSNNVDRRTIAKKMLKESYKRLSSSQRQNDAQMLIDSQKLFQNLINLAGLLTKDKHIKWNMDAKVTLSNFIVPCESTLLNPDSVEVNRWSGSVAGSINFAFISSFIELVEVASSKAKPKTFTFETTCGKRVKFLCKQEKDGDLRKDSHMMEINNVINRLFGSNSHSRKRRLRLRTYAVVCLNEECGILEWVINTECLRQVIAQAHSYLAKSQFYPYVTYKEVYHQYVDMQNKFDDDLNGLVAAYKNLIFGQHRYLPCLHKWFLEKFSDPSLWMESKTIFIRSIAVWSGVGHMIGLGDRHTENILIDVTNGECVHVDFDCLFDKGLTLLKPEIIPFRLTSNMIDGMGIIGIEGTFRIALETTLQVLRENKEVILSILEPFLSDPTVAWGRRGRAQKAAQIDATSVSKSSHAHDTENKEAREMLQKIGARLIGIYNVMHPHRDKLLNGAVQKGDLPPSRGIGPSRDELLPLSVAGQVQRLIDEATALENLAQLYIGTI